MRTAEDIGRLEHSLGDSRAREVVEMEVTQGQEGTHVIEAPSTRAKGRTWLGLAVLALPCIMYSMNATILNLALPAISAALRPSSTEVLWIVDIYGFVLSGFLLLMGPLGDRIGRRRLLLAGAAGFGATSVLSAVATTPGELIAARGLLGLFAATLAPSTLSMIRGMFSQPRQRTIAIGIWTASHSLGAAIGPLLGGIVIERFGWGAAFLLGAPFMLALLVVGPFTLPELKVDSPRSIDLWSVIQSVLATLLLVYGIKQCAVNGITSRAAISLLLGLIVGVTFTRRQRRLKDPLLDFDLLKNNVSRIALFSYSLGCFVASGVFLFFSQYLQLVRGLTPLEAGLWTIAVPAGLTLGSLCAPRYASLVNGPAAMVTGLVVCAVGLAFTATSVGATTSVNVASLSQLCVYFGLALMFIPAIETLIGSAPEEKASEMSAIAESSSELGAALGVALLGSFGAIVYRDVMTGALFGLSLSPSTEYEATRSLANSLAIASHLSREHAAVLLHRASDAYTTSFRLISLICLLLIVFLLVFLPALTRSGRSPAKSPPYANRSS